MQPIQTMLVWDIGNMLYISKSEGHCIISENKQQVKVENKLE